MSYLLDTNVLSEIRKGSRANPNVRAWFDPVPTEELYISVLALGEIRKGVELLRHRDRAAASSYERWLDSLKANFADRILPVTDIVTDHWGRLGAIRPLPVADGLMAATALVHSLTFVTRNAADVRDTGVSLLNPF
ncbi:MAG TPA: type II toxin-antitoxin system VapC family toxin [Verrucomicrobiae bacterium]|nr:type II toxin-antitoxin system VapC family toxin [Verrucomicrobiae bacterium]